MFRELKFGGAGSTRLKAPESDFDKAAYLILIGFSAIIASLFLPIHDFVLETTSMQTIGQLKSTEPLLKKGGREQIGVYEFTDTFGSKINAKGVNSYKNKSQIPQSAKIAYKPGEPQNARVLYQGGFSWPFLILGIIAAGFGFQILVKDKKRKQTP